MNYIKRLEAENAEKANKIAALKAELSNFRLHLELPKFRGADEHGDRKDWISTGDVVGWLERLRVAVLFGSAA